MARFINDPDLEDLIGQLEGMAGHTESICKRAVFDGARVIADAAGEATRGLPLDSDGRFVKGSDPLRVITAEDRADLEASIGISRIRRDSDGAVTVSVSFDGYIRRTEKNFPNGVPAVMIARSIESGSSVRAKNPFMRRAVNAARARCEAAMRASVDQSIEHYTQTNEEG